MFVQRIFKVPFIKNRILQSGQRPNPWSVQKNVCTKSCVLWFVTTFVWKKWLHNAFLRNFHQKTELCYQGRGHTRWPILLICNPSRELYHIRSHAKFGWANSTIFWVIVPTDRQTDTDDMPKLTFLDSVALKMWRPIKISRSVFWTDAILYTSYSRENNNNNK